MLCAVVLRAHISSRSALSQLLQTVRRNPDLSSSVYSINIWALFASATAVCMSYTCKPASTKMSCCYRPRPIPVSWQSYHCFFHSTFPSDRRKHVLRSTGMQFMHIHIIHLRPSSSKTTVGFLLQQRQRGRWVHVQSYDTQLYHHSHDSTATLRSYIKNFTCIKLI